MREPVARRLDTTNETFYQPLNEHLWDVATHAKSIGDELNLGWASFVLGLFHDLSKSCPDFQEMILSKSNTKVNHSSGGAVYLIEKFTNSFNKTSNDPILEIFSYVIYAHHGLFDLIPANSGTSAFIRRYNYIEDQSSSLKVMQDFLKENIENKLQKKYNISLDQLLLKAYDEAKDALLKLHHLSSNAKTNNLALDKVHYYSHLLVRLLLSILKEADIYNSANAFSNESDPLLTECEALNCWTFGVDKIENLYDSFSLASNPSTINQVRSKLAEDAKVRASESFNGALKAELPTGSGKTLLTTRFALHHNLFHKKKRFFYITAFLSVLEQNAQEIESFFEPDTVLEHHSNAIIETDEKNAENHSNNHYLQQYLIDSWEKPVVVTSMVQFCNTLLKGKSSNIRRFCKLINSTIVLDEIQSLPASMTYNMNLITNFLTNMMKVTIVHCTATQPEYDSEALDYPTLYNTLENEELVKLTLEDSSVFKRVRAFQIGSKKMGLNITDLCSHIQESMDTADSILFVGNTKSVVRNVYNKLKSGELRDFYIFNLTTDQCAAHRLKKINEIKAMLNDGKKVLVCSSQLIEAGVDLDFHVVYRSLASISSLIQAMGRCNREGKRPYGLFYIFDLSGENTSSLPEIKKAKDVTRQILHYIDESEIDLESLRKSYFEKLYSNPSGDELKYPLENHSPLLDLLALNASLRAEFYMTTRESYPHTFAQSFRSAADLFELIPKSGDTVIVSLNEQFGDLGNENRKLIEDLDLAWENRDYPSFKKTLLKLQRYTIQLRSIDEYLPFIRTLENVNILLPDYYDLEFGINTDQLSLLFV